MHSLHPGSDSPAAPGVGDPAARRLHLLVLAAGLLWFAFWYRDTLMAMVGIWERSDTFTHGYVIAPISAWLIWRRRHFIHGVDIVPSLFGIVIGLGAGAAWLLGELASVDAVITKPGYGTLVEAACSGVPILYVEREDWPETPWFAAWLATHARAAVLRREQLAGGDFIAALNRLWQAPPPAVPAANGATEAAQLLVRELGLA